MSEQQQQQGERSPKKSGVRIQEMIESEAQEISLGRVVDADRIVTRTAQVLLKVCTTQPWGGVPRELIRIVREHGRALQRHNPLEFEIGNTVMRVLRFIRRAAELVVRDAAAAAEAAAAGDTHFRGRSALVTSAIITSPSPVAGADAPQTPSRELSSGSSSSGGALDSDQHALSVSRVLSVEPDAKPYLAQPFNKQMRAQLRDQLCTSLADFKNEVGVALDEIGAQAREHVHPNECVFVYGYSRAVLCFLCAAKRYNVRFEVLVAENAPRGDGQDMAVELVRAGITTTLVPDAALFAMMPRINKVFCGAHAIMANGGVLGAAGTSLVALAAHRHGVPFIVCASLVKLTPHYPYDVEVLSCLANPAEVLPYAELRSPDRVDVLNPRFDYVPPELVSLLITDHGCHTPSFVYRLLEEYYDAEDYQYPSD